jgi:uncharacterized membrane protein YfcA
MSGIELLELFAIGLGTGVIGALLGIGGGVILVPGLALILGVPLRAAVATSLVCIVATSVASSIVHLPRARVSLLLAIELESFTVFGAVVGGLVAGFIPAAPLYFAFAALLGYTGYKMWPRRRAEGPRKTHIHWARAASTGAGVISSLLGVGGGVLKVPVLNLLMDLDFERTTATSIYMIGLTTATGAMIYLVRGDVRFHVAAATALGTIAGSGVAALVGHRFDTRALKGAFALILLYVAYEMVRHGLAHT